MSLDTDRLSEYARLRYMQKKLKNKSEEIGQKADKMQQSLIDNLIDNDVDKISLKGGTILYITALIWAKCIKDPETDKTDKPKVIQALKDAKLEWLVENNFNSNRLSGYLRELDEAGEKLPESFKGIIEANPASKLVAKKV